MHKFPCHQHRVRELSGLISCCEIARSIDRLLELGVRYQVVNKIGLLSCLHVILTHIIYKLSGTRSLLSKYGLVFFMWIATSPPNLAIYITTLYIYRSP